MGNFQTKGLVSTGSGGKPHFLLSNYFQLQNKAHFLTFFLPLLPSSNGKKGGGIKIGGGGQKNQKLKRESEIGQFPGTKNKTKFEAETKLFLEFSCQEKKITEIH